MNLKRIKRLAAKPTVTADEIIDALGVEIPRVETQPRLEDFGLSAEAVKTIEAAREARHRRLKAVEHRLLVVAYPIFIVLFTGALLVIRGDYTAGENLVSEIIFGILVGGFAGLFLVYAPIHEHFDGTRATTSSDDDSLAKYRAAVENYEYWQRKKQTTFP